MLTQNHIWHTNVSPFMTYYLSSYQIHVSNFREFSIYLHIKFTCLTPASSLLSSHQIHVFNSSEFFIYLHIKFVCLTPVSYLFFFTSNSRVQLPWVVYFSMWNRKLKKNFRMFVTMWNLHDTKITAHSPVSAEDMNEWSYTFVFHTPSTGAQGQPYF